MHGTTRNPYGSRALASRERSLSEHIVRSQMPVLRITVVTMAYSGLREAVEVPWRFRIGIRIESELDPAQRWPLLSSAPTFC